MTKVQANLLRGFSIWTVFVWATRIKNVFDQASRENRGTGFIVVHVIIGLVSVAFAATCWWIVTQNRGRNAPKVERPEEAKPAFLSKR
jgi:hypothetical protein